MSVELVFLFFGELQAYTAYRSRQGIEQSFPTLPPEGEHTVIVGSGLIELIHPLMNGRHTVEHLARKEAILCRGDERLHLGWRSTDQYAEI